MQNQLAQCNFLKKSGLTLQCIARDLYLLPEASKIPTIQSYANRISVSKRTVQDAFDELAKLDLVQLDKRGCKGSFIKQKNQVGLYNVSGWSAITGIMPVPFTDGLKSLATAFYEDLSPYPELCFSFAFIQGSIQRAGRLQRMPSTFMVASLSSAKQICAESNQFKIALSLENCLYSQPYVLAYRKDQVNKLEQCELIGCDLSSHDQSLLSLNLAEKKGLQILDIPYVGLLRALLQKRIDLTIYRSEPSLTENPELAFSPLTGSLISASEASIPAVIVHKKDYGLDRLLQQVIVPTQISRKQSLILEDHAQAMFR